MPIACPLPVASIQLKQDASGGQLNSYGQLRRRDLPDVNDQEASSSSASDHSQDAAPTERLEKRDFWPALFAKLSAMIHGIRPENAFRGLIGTTIKKVMDRSTSGKLGQEWQRPKLPSYSASQPPRLMPAPQPLPVVAVPPQRPVFAVAQPGGGWSLGYSSSSSM